MANMEVKDEVFELPINIEANGTVTKILQTQDTYVDKNIKVVIETPDATYKTIDSGEVTASVSTTDTTYTSDTVTDYAIVIAADASVSDVKVGVDQAGFAAETDTITVAGSDAEQATKTIYVKAGALGGEGDVAVEGKGGVELTKVAAEPESGFYIKANGSGSVGVETAGWVDPAKNASVSTDAEAFYTLASAQLNNAETAGQTYTTKNAPILISGKGLYINEGYIENTYIPLADLVPDEATVVAGEGGNSNLIYNTVSVYDKDGTLIAGTMGDATLSDITASEVEATVANLTVAAAEDGANFKVTGTGDISGASHVEIATTGYATTALAKDGVIEGTANVNATLAKIGIGVETSGNDGEVTPVISKEDSTTALSGDITTTAPAAGKYVAISTAEIKEVVTITPKVLTEGYGTADVHSATGDTINAGAAASGTYYVPITAGSHEVVANASDVTKAATTVTTDVTASDARTLNGVLATAPATGDYITIGTTTTATAGTVKASTTCTVTEGYVEADSKTTNINESVEVVATEAAAKYIKIYDGAVL